ncbi:MAG: class I SAM-dependent methyltransferase [Bacteroidetes bacterium]|nr:class I SAM-dependent methyltransferase [Bacteroidota bacterium]
MNYEKQYYEYDGFWSDYETSYKNNIEKINISFEFIQPDVKTILDAACGNGIFTNMLIEKYPDLKVVAFDRSEAALKYVKAEKFIAEINQMPFKDAQFDCVVAHDVIEHLPVGVYEQALKEIARVAKKYIIIGVPNDEKVLDRSTQCPSCKAIFNYDLHMRSFSKEKMNDLFSAYGFKCKQIRTCDKNTFFIGHKWYVNIFYSEQKKEFKAPICPICGYSEVAPERFSNVGHRAIVNNKTATGLFAKLKQIPKAIWPKRSFDYEMVALFEK